MKQLEMNFYFAELRSASYFSALFEAPMSLVNDTEPLPAAVHPNIKISWDLVVDSINSLRVVIPQLNDSIVHKSLLYVI